jgi:GNAT superfamily N-acetyltransferase
MGITIRIATNADEKAIDDFDHFSGNRPKEISNNEVWIAEVNGELAGYITFNYSFYRKPFIKYLNTHPKFERQGIADTLVKFIEENAKAKNCLSLRKQTIFQCYGFLRKTNTVWWVW